MNGYLIDQIVGVVGEQHREALVDRFKDMDAIVWSLEDGSDLLDEDGMYRGEPFSEEDLRDVLHEVISDHDSSIGVTWESFRAELDYVVERRKRDRGMEP